MDFNKYTLDNFDLSKFTRFQKAVFDPLILGSGFRTSSISEEEYRWKFKGAWKEGIIYLAEEGDSIIASSTIVPYLMEDSKGNNLWCVQVFDNAVDKNYRKKNMFYRVYEYTYANKFQYTCFGFPNENAIKTGLKFNGHIKAQLFFWVKVNLGLKAFFMDRNVTSEVLTAPSEIKNFQPYIKSFSIRKDADYIRWRYFERPGKKYRVFRVAVEGEDGYSLIVLAETIYRGFHLNLVMDVLGTNDFYHNNGLKLFMDTVRKHGVFIGLSNDTTQMNTAGFYKLPDFIAPKKHFLVYTERESTPFQIKSLTWHSSMGDWEVF